MTNKLKIRLLIFGSVISWLLYAVMSLYCLFLEEHNMLSSFTSIIPDVFLSIFVVISYYYFWYNVSKIDAFNFTEMLWKVFLTGLITTICSLGIQLFFRVFSGSNISENAIAINFLYTVQVGLVVIFLISTLVVWKRLILYQKSKRLLQLWHLFEITLVGAIIFDFFKQNPSEVPFSLSLILLTIFSIVLIFNLKWVAYLNFKQKWKGILFILLSGVYLYHFSQNLIMFTKTQMLYLDLTERVLFIGIFIFLILYASIAILVTLFNLPTSSVFEQKLKEAIDFQKLTMAIPQGQTKDHTYEILLDSSMSAVFADAAWIEMKDDGILKQTLRNIDYKKIEEVKKGVGYGNVSDTLNYAAKYTTIPSQKFIDKVKTTNFRSIIAFPIFVKEEQVGVLAMLNEVSDAFNKEMVNIITTFVSQASISMENLSLLQESLETERYKEQLTIAKNVQKSLLPSTLINNENLKIDAFSQAADEVGGDYYDFIQHSEHQYSLIIADVSGKGTSAAFQMAQMKGVFHSLATQEIAPSTFNIEANRALSNCLDKSSFITATYFKIDTQEKQIAYSRAGHCPSLFYDAKTKKSEFLSSEGMGLCVLRNQMYQDFVTDNTIHYQNGDTLLLYTDGVTEGMNSESEQFGNDRLKASFQKHITNLPNQVKDKIREDLSSFTGMAEIDDDYTMVIIQFKK